MFDINALMKALPIYGLEPQTLAWVKGFPKPSRYSFSDDSFKFFEPPAGQHEPFVEPVDLMQRLFIMQGEEADAALGKALLQYAELRSALTCYERPVFYDSFDPESKEHVAVPIILRFMREKSLAPEDTLKFFENAAAVTKEIPVFDGPEIHRFRCKLSDLPNMPSPKAMLEFVPDPPWLEDYDETDSVTDRFLSWRETMRPIAESLEKQFGEPAYYFCEWGDELDDDDVHRFLVLHWCCSYKPESAFIRYLLEVSGAHSAEELQTALINPSNYTYPYKMNSTFMGAESCPCRLSYLPSGATKTVGIVFATEKARSAAGYIALQQIGARIKLAAPINLLYDESIPAYLTRPGLMSQSLRFAQSGGCCFLQDGTMDDPITFLAGLDELFVVADDERSGQGFDLKLSDSVEELLWIALDLKIPAHYTDNGIHFLGNPEVSLEKRGVPARVSAKQQRREEYTKNLRMVQLAWDWSSSGLWTHDGKNISYDSISLPLPLIRRIIAWHNVYEKMVNTDQDKCCWRENEKEQIEIAKELQKVLGPSVAVVVGIGKKSKTVADLLATPV